MKSAMKLVEQLITEEQLRLTEAEVAGLLRDESYEDTNLWNRAENYGLSIISNLEEQIDSFDPDDVNGGNERLATLAAHLLWSCAKRRQSLQDVEEAAFVALNAAVLFLFTANISGASAIAHEMQSWSIQDRVYSRVINLLLGFPFLPERRDRPSPTNHAVYLYYRATLEGSQPKQIDLLTTLTQELSMPEKELSHAQVALIYRIEQTIPWLSKFLMPLLIAERFDQRNSYVQYIHNFGPFFAFPTQRQAFKAISNQNTENILITFPTSTGKTFLGEFFALESLLQGHVGVAVYIAPYRAIVTQVADRCRARVETAGITVVPAMGGYLEGLSEKLSGERVFLIATFEAFDYALRSQPSLISRIVSLAVDELHLLEQPGRGTLLECLIGRIKDLQANIRLIGLSAVIENTEALCEWMGVPQSNSLRTAWSPTKKRFTVQMPQDRARFYGDPARRSSQIKELSWNMSSGITRIPFQFDERRHLPRFAQAHKGAEVQIQRASARASVELHNKLSGPVLIICASRPETRVIARYLLEALEPAMPTPAASELMDLLQDYYPHQKSLLSMIPYRVCYHNSDIEYEIRERLEKLIGYKYFKVVVSTTTLAEGVDLPFRTVLLHRWTHYSAGGNASRALFSTLLMRNVVGRCGRAGMFVEGDTIFADNPTDDPIFARIETIESHYIKPRSISLRSSLQSTPVGTEVDSRIAIQLESATLALIKQRASISSPEALLADKLLCPKDASRLYTDYLASIITSEVSKSVRPLLVANSPVTLSPLGEMAAQTGLSIVTSARIALLLDSLVQSNASPSSIKRLISNLNLRWNGWMDKVFEELGDVRELFYYNPPVPKSEIPMLMWTWYSGWSLPAILWAVRYRLKKDADTDIKVSWLKNPTGPNDDLEDRIAELRSYCDSWFGRMWPRILRAVASFVAFSNSDLGVESVFFEDTIKSIAQGVSNQFAVQLIDRTIVSSFPGDRTTAEILSRWYISKGYNDVFSIQITDVKPTLEQLCSFSIDPQGISNLAPKTAEKLVAWLEMWQRG